MLTRKWGRGGKDRHTDKQRDRQRERSRQTEMVE